MALTDKQKRFCEEYVIDLNATQACIRSGYSEDSAKEQGSRLLTNANIQEYILELQNAKADELNITFNDLARIELDIAYKGEKDSDRLRAVDQLSKKLGFYERDNKQKQTILNMINLGDGEIPDEATTETE